MKGKIQLTKEILQKLLIGGAIIYAAQSPYLWLNLYKRLFFGERFPKKRVRDTFYYLKKRGLIDIQKKNKQIYISLTKEGERKAGRFQINKLRINPQKKWDRKWWAIIFDIPENSRIKREAFRGKLKELGFYKLQKSVWLYPYPCEKEIELLRDFFGLNKIQLQVLVIERMEDDGVLRKHFNLD